MWSGTMFMVNPSWVSMRRRNASAFPSHGESDGADRKIAFVKLGPGAVSPQDLADLVEFHLVPPQAGPGGLSHEEQSQRNNYETPGRQAAVTIQDIPQPWNVITQIAVATMKGQRLANPLPGHGDKNPSLSLNEGEGGKILVYCHTAATRRR